MFEIFSHLEHSQQMNDDDDDDDDDGDDDDDDNDNYDNDDDIAKFLQIARVAHEWPLIFSHTFQRFPHSKQSTKVVIGSSALRVCSCV